MPTTSMTPTNTPKHRYLDWQSCTNMRKHTYAGLKYKNTLACICRRGVFLNSRSFFKISHGVFTKIGQTVKLLYCRLDTQSNLVSFIYSTKKGSKWYWGFVSNFEWWNLAAVFTPHLACTQLGMFCGILNQTHVANSYSDFKSALLVFKTAFLTQKI